MNWFAGRRKQRDKDSDQDEDDGEADYYSEDDMERGGGYDNAVARNDHQSYITTSTRRQVSRGGGQQQQQQQRVSRRRGMERVEEAGDYDNYGYNGAREGRRWLRRDAGYKEGKMQHPSAESSYGGGDGGGGGGSRYDDYIDDDDEVEDLPVGLWAQGSEILQSASEVIRSHSPIIVLVCLVLLSFSLFLTQSNMGSLVSCREELSVSDKVKVDLLAKNSDAIKEKRDSLNEVELMKGELQAANDELKEKTAALRAAEESLGDLRREADEFRRQSEQKIARISILEADLSQCNTDMEQLEEELAEKHKVLELANSHLSGHLDKTSALESREY